MHTVYIKDFNQWREQARQLIVQNISPEYVQWVEPSSEQTSLFSDAISVNNSSTVNFSFNVSKAFMEIAKKVSCHRSVKKWSLLYTALWRMVQGEKHLLLLSTDTIVYELMRMQKQVSRDVHKMKAFVRFKSFEQEGKEIFIAWHRPDHLILTLAAPFFQRRFGVMNWMIVTPDGALFWDKEKLRFDESITALEEPIVDDMETLWLTYYRAIFNPARIKLKAMRNEMPVRHWQTMPETQIIASMLQEAPQRVAKMIKYSEGIAESAADFLPENLSIDCLRTAAVACEGCPLYRGTTQTVFGIGLTNAYIMFVGEQPGDSEDQKGVPFAGPAGQMLNQILEAAGIVRETIYLTNAVKHFKHRQEGQRRIHVSPNIREINACKPWLLAEINTVQPKLIVCLGLTAARSLMSHGFHMKEQRGRWRPFSTTQQIMATYHPSAILRAVNESQRQEIFNYLLHDLKTCTNM